MGLGRGGTRKSAEEARTIKAPLHKAPLHAHQRARATRVVCARRRVPLRQRIWRLAERRVSDAALRQPYVRDASTPGPASRCKSGRRRRSCRRGDSSAARPAPAASRAPQLPPRRGTAETAPSGRASAPCRS
eukprot:613653-Pleurochrysis_carterae.AAC.2